MQNTGDAITQSNGKLKCLKLPEKLFATMEQSSLQKKKFNQKFLHIIGPMECRKMFIERWVHYSHSAFVYFLVGCHAGAVSIPG